jgi:S1-C subfamily serine protease
VVAIGNPFREQGSMSLGIVSGLDRSLRLQRASPTGANSVEGT